MTEISISTTDRAILEGEGVRFTSEGVIFPNGTACAPGTVSESRGRKSTLRRYHLSAPSLLEISHNLVEEGDQVICSEVSIPLMGAYQFALVRNNDPEFRTMYQEYAYSPMSGTWSNEYADHPVGPNIILSAMNYDRRTITTSEADGRREIEALVERGSGLVIHPARNHQGYVLALERGVQVTDPISGPFAESEEVARAWLERVVPLIPYWNTDLLKMIRAVEGQFGTFNAFSERIAQELVTARADFQVKHNA
jgi:hypothetical protein